MASLAAEHFWKSSGWSSISPTPGDLVLDPCSGGATTAAACFGLGRKCIACDLEKKHVVNGRKRLAELAKLS